MKKERTRPRSDYNNKQSYDDELALVRKLLKGSKQVEKKMIERVEQAYKQLCEVYSRELPFYFKDGINQKKLNELLVSLRTGEGHFDTEISKVLDEIKRETRALQNDYLTAWLILDYEFTAKSTAKSIGIKPDSYINLLVEQPDKVQHLIEKPWCKDNKTYADRIWEATEKMDSNLRAVITQGIQRGWSLERMTQIFRNITGAEEYKARRLLRTETMAVYSKVTKDIFLENGIEYVEIIGDAMCGGICLDYVGQAIPLKEAELGDDLPPYHPNCACSFCSYEEFAEDSELLDDSE